MSGSQVKGHLGLLPTMELYLVVPEPVCVTVRVKGQRVYTVMQGPKAGSSVGSHLEWLEDVGRLGVL